jgi:hypothetical protein
MHPRKKIRQSKITQRSGEEEERAEQHEGRP